MFTCVVCAVCIFAGIQIIGYEETFEVGETADVTCSSDLDVLNIKWYLDEDSTSTTLVTSYTSVNELKFRPVTASVNDAQYTCQVTSPYGVQSKTVILHAESESHQCLCW